MLRPGDSHCRLFVLLPSARDSTSFQRLFLPHFLLIGAPTTLCLDLTDPNDGNQLPCHAIPIIVLDPHGNTQQRLILLLSRDYLFSLTHPDLYLATDFAANLSVKGTADDAEG